MRPSRPTLLPLAALAILAWAGITLLHAHAAEEAIAASPVLPTQRASHHARTRPSITLFGEALCQDTAAWVVRILAPAVEAGLVGPARRGQDSAALSPLLPDEEEEEDEEEVEPASASARHSSRPVRPPSTFSYVGWGNAKLNASSQTPACQHGPPECRLDALLNCAASLERPRRALDLLLCHFRAVEAKGRVAVADDPGLIAECAKTVGIRDWARLQACAAGGKGAALARRAAADTEKGAAGKNFVPWVVVDGRAMGSDCGALVARVCGAVKEGGGRVPEVCERPPVPAPACPGAPGRVAVGAVRPLR